MFKKHKKSWLMLAIALGAILVSSFCGSLIQSKGYSIEITDLRDAENEGYLLDAQGNPIQQVDAEGNPVVNKDGSPAYTAVDGLVKSGILYMPKDASETNPLPGIVLTHGYLNNRELQMPFAVELARRGFIVLAVDREGHGNYENSGTTGAMMATNGMYDSVKYLYNLPEVDNSKIGISGHSMGGFTTAMTLMQDAMGLKIISAGLMQGWSSFMGAGANVDVGMLKAKDDEFFFTSKDVDGNPTICRQFLQSQGAASFVGDMSWRETGKIDIKDGGVYVGGKLVETNQGTAVDGAFRVVYEADEIHPLNHFSVESTGYMVDFFYNAFGTPNGHKYIKSTNQVWWLKEATATIGWAGIIFMIFPLVSLLLCLPFFADLKKRRVETADGRVVYEELDAAVEAGGKAELKGLRKHLSFWIPAVACTLFSGFSIAPIQQWAGDVINQSALFPQDTTGWVAVWAICCGLFALTVILLTNGVNRVINHFLHKEEANENVLDVVHTGGFGRFVRTVILGVLVVIAMYLVLFANWGVFKTDFRFWTFAMKVFDVEVMLPTMLRYACLFGIFYVCNAIGNQTYRVKNLPEWASIAINAFFNVAGIALVFAIQYGTFCSTGVMWKPEMNLSYIVLFPIIPVLICATIISRVLYKKTGNIWLGAVINTLLWTVVTVSGTAASFGYIFA